MNRLDQKLEQLKLENLCGGGTQQRLLRGVDEGIEEIAVGPDEAPIPAEANADGHVLEQDALFFSQRDDLGTLGAAGRDVFDIAVVNRVTILLNLR